MNILYILGQVFWFVVILIPLVVIHEFGHLIIARINKVKVPEFGIGIPPRIVYKKWKGIIWSLNWILLGGFVRIYGDNDAIDEAHDVAKTDKKKAKEGYLLARKEEIIANKELQFFLEDNNLGYNQDWKAYEKAKAADKQTAGYQQLDKQLSTLIDWEFETKLHSNDTFFSKNVFQKVAILLGGITFNMISAFILFMVVIQFFGAPQLSGVDFLNSSNSDITIEKKGNLILQSVGNDTPAAQAGLSAGDELLTVDGENTKDWGDVTRLIDIIATKKDEPILVKYQKKDSNEVREVVVSAKEDNGVYRIGVTPAYVATIRANGFVSLVKLSWNYTTFVTTETVKQTGDILRALLPSTKDKQALNGVGGPVAVSYVGSQIFGQQGIAGILVLMAIISISLAVFNLLPIPALDGGRIVIVLINSIFKVRNRKLEAIIINVTFLLLLVVGVFIAFKDVQNISLGKLN